MVYYVLILQICRETWVNRDIFHQTQEYWLAVETDLGSLKHNFLEARSYYILHIRSEIDLLFLLRDHHGPVTIIPNRLPGIVVVLG